MNSKFAPINFLLTVIACVLAGFVPSCAPKSSKNAAAIELEVRSDGKSYQKGSSTPYSGTYLHLGKNAVKHEEIHYKDGLMHGPYFTYNREGILKRRTDFEAGSKLRKRVWYFNGQMKADETWLVDRVFGLCTYWFPDGRIRKQMRVGNDFRAEGHVLEYAEDGTVLIDAICELGVLVTGKCKPGIEPYLSRRYSQDDVSIKDVEEKEKEKELPELVAAKP